VSRYQDKPAPAQARTSTGSLLGRPRRDARILTVLSVNEWTKGADVAEQLGLSLTAAYVALWRAERRGLLEHRRGQGYRLKEQRS
jgi:DNA-binding IclR family transcriptional regulator